MLAEREKLQSISGTNRLRAVNLTVPLGLLIEADTPLQSKFTKNRRLLIGDVVNWMTTGDPQSATSRITASGNYPSE